ncbi:type II toxin-antitoxin system RelE/ParE family toxin [Enterobacter ludwigii]|uniref:type II toxin-antitoxin system RelE/ParE family toxin n=1 Tax=Enterobacter TaxID=547 RepID=UPI00069BF0FF|nr:type II toxin-antitoxin system RelE/ParE family toxin [Enterobacter ludwigii]
MKDITYWNEEIQDQIDNYPEAVRERINFELVALQSDCPHSFDDFDFPVDDSDVQQGDAPEFPPARKKSMKETIGRYAMQLTIKSTDSYRVIYVAKFKESIYILHTFKKKTEGVAKKEYGTASSRYKQLERYRRDKKLK